MSKALRRFSDMTSPLDANTAAAWLTFPITEAAAEMAAAAFRALRGEIMTLATAVAWVVVNPVLAPARLAVAEVWMEMDCCAASSSAAAAVSLAEVIVVIVALKALTADENPGFTSAVICAKMS